MTEQKLFHTYEKILLEGIVPFWWEHGLDREYGGVLSCMDESGQVLSGNKYTWSQARFVWVCAALYNRVEKRAEFLEAAERGADFLLRHGRDGEGRWVYQMTRTGEVVEGAISIYADCFAIYGLSELYRANGDARLLEAALRSFWRVVRRIDEPEFNEVAPYQLPRNRRPHAISMMLTEVASELAITTGDAAVEEVAERHAMLVMERFVRADLGALVEFLDWEYRPLDGNEGTAVMPGHAMECMWFVIHWAQRRGKEEVVRRAIEVLRWHMELGWDKEFGGIFLGMDARGGAPFIPNAEKKVWWPHTEALYALLLAHRISGEAWCMEWYWRVHEWSFAKFAMAGGEWRQRLDREGNPITELIALPVKDPFHLPRAVILIMQLLKQGA